MNGCLTRPGLGGGALLLAVSAALASAALLAAVPARAQEGNVLSNLFKYGGTTVPPSQPKDLEPAYCPPIDVAEGGAALRTLAGGAVRTQVSLGRLARECARREDGSITVKVGVEARVLLGPAGTPGRFDVPVTVRIKAADKAVVTRTERTTATVESGEAQGFATIVVDDLRIPPALTADYEIEVGLGAGGAKEAKSKEAKSKAAKSKDTKSQAAGARSATRKAQGAEPASAGTPDGGGDAAQ